MRLLISGGGTGGHLFPALAVARAFRAEHPQGALLLVGKAGGPEERLVPAAGFELATVTARGLDRDAIWKNLALPVLLPGALVAALRIVDRFKPDVVLGMGGYAMAPALAAAIIRHVPFVLHEKDVRPGLATRIFASRAAAICTSLPGTEARLAGRRCVMTGVPLRPGFAPRIPAAPPERLLVMGGSQGARHINETVWAALDGLLDRFREVVHLTGEQGAADGARRRRPGYQPAPFSEDIPALMAGADLVLGRAGVGSIAELTAVGLPAILVPGTFGGGHQEENAKALAGAGAAIRIGDAELGAGSLLAAIDGVDADRWRRMAAASRAMGRLDADRRVLRVIEEVAA